MYRLLFQGQAPSRAPFVTKEPLAFIGRDTACQLRLLDNGVRDRHAAIERRDDGYYVRELEAGSATPVAVRVNGQLTRSQRLATGDELEVGAVRLRFEIVHEPTRQRRRPDPIFAAAAAIIAGSIIGQALIIAQIVATRRPHDTSKIAGERSSFLLPAEEPADTPRPVAPAVVAPPPASTPMTVPAAVTPTVLDRMIRITRVERTDAATHLTLNLVVKAQIAERALDPTQVAISIQIFGFDGNGQPRPALDPFWMSIPAWENFSSKSFAIRYPLPPAQFAGYVVRTFYRGRLQDVAAMPPELLALAPPLTPPGRP